MLLKRTLTLCYRFTFNYIAVISFAIIKIMQILGGKFIKLYFIFAVYAGYIISMFNTNAIHL